MKIGNATGVQIAFFTFALLLLAAPATEFVAKAMTADPSTRKLIGRALVFGPAMLILFGIPSVRRRTLQLLARRIPTTARSEVVVVALLKALLFALAIGGAIALWAWLRGGPERLASVVVRETPVGVQMPLSLSTASIVHQFLFASLLAPLVEELVFRGFLYQAWERRWGAWPAMLLASTLFALYHPQFLPSFMSGVVLTALLWRTGSLWAPIAAHAAYNFTLWYPFMGRHIIPSSAEAQASLSGWTVQLIALCVAAIAIPFYVGLATRSPAKPLANAV